MNTDRAVRHLPNNPTTFIVITSIVGKNGLPDKLEVQYFALRIPTCAEYASIHGSWMVLENAQQCQTMLNNIKTMPWLAAYNVCSFKQSETCQLSRLRSPLFLRYAFPEAAHQCLTWVLYHLGCMPLFRHFLNSPIREASYPVQGWFPYPCFLPTQLSQPMDSCQT